ncbi:hypothetical protein CRENBAI_021896 [Crenichthys baileyi]|uniref:Uncharacterized protein n=1 Tax=Crenichthys baileyi TaxID=28760 RepID=A0AAV9SRU4_9TELE
MPPSRKVSQREATDLPPSIRDRYSGDRTHRHPKPPRARDPQKDHYMDYRNPPREEQRRAPGKPPSSHSTEAPGSCSNKPTGPVGSRLRRGRYSHGSRDPRPRVTSSPKQWPDRARGLRFWQAATRSELAHTITYMPPNTNATDPLPTGAHPYR